MSDNMNVVLSGRYKLIEPVGAGGMAVVYRAWDREENREVAVKVLRSEYNDDADFIRRFNMEAQAASKMSHPNIVSIYGVGQDGNSRYIVMEYVHGRTLKELIRQQGRIEPRRAVQLTLKILAAVNCAHKNHVIHRDIKPQNILVDTKGDIKVADFGIARATNTTTHTYNSSSSILGSVHYFSPEQADGQVADEKSDLYSVGIVLYEMVTGKVPFDGESPISVAIMHMQATPKSPKELEPRVSESLNLAIMKALNKDPAQRYQSAADMALDLRRAILIGNSGSIYQKFSAFLEKLKAIPLKKIRNAFLTILIGAAVIAAAVFGRYIYRMLFVRRDMPNLVLVDIEDAVETLTGMNLEYTIEEKHNAEISKGLVIEQSPQAHQDIWPGDRVQLVVSMGREKLEMPKLVGLTRQEAVRVLDGNDLLPGSITLEIADAPAGTVVSQVPAEGEWVKPGDKVDLSVSGESAEVPNVTGYRLDEAQSRLVAAGFLLGDVFDAVSEADEGEVIAQSVAPGTVALMGSAVNLTISQSEPVMYRAKTKVVITATAGGAQVLCTLMESAGEREVYRAELPEGRQEIELDIRTEEKGKHVVRIYLNGEVTAESEIEFTEEA